MFLTHSLNAALPPARRDLHYRRNGTLNGAGSAVLHAASGIAHLPAGVVLWHLRAPLAVAYARRTAARRARNDLAESSPATALPCTACRMDRGALRRIVASRRGGVEPILTRDAGGGAWCSLVFWLIAAYIRRALRLRPSSLGTILLSPFVVTLSSRPAAVWPDELPASR